MRLDKTWWRAAGIRALKTVALVLMDSDGTVYENKHLTTAYEPEE